MKTKAIKMTTTLALLAGISIGFYVSYNGLPLIGEAYAAEGQSMTRTVLADFNGTIQNPYMYYPGTGALKPFTEKHGLPPVREFMEAQK